MKVIYNPAVGVIRIVLSEVAVAEGNQDKPGVMLD